MYNFTEIFSIPILKAKIESKELNLFLKKEALSLQKNTKTVVKSNVGGFQSNLLAWDNKYLNLKNKVDFFIKVFLENLTVKKPFNITYSCFWININKKENYNLWHCHGKHDFSCVYYISTPKNSPKLVLNNPVLHKKTSTIMYENNNLWSVCREIYCEVAEGDFFIFPSYLEHMVEKSNLNKPRISLAFNIDIVQ
jgi:uncharacterized protein (TIGR02466 family)